MASSDGDDVNANGTNSTHMNQSDENTAYYYFGYGPMVHPTTRERRGINVVDEKPAVLRNYRLTFAYGGVASAVQQRGFDVHGVVMKCATVEDWEKLKSFEVGTFYPTIEEVHLYGNDDDDDDDIDDQEEDPVMPLNDDYNDNTNTRIIRAHVFHMVDFDESKLEEPIEKLPQERYLKLIASGMQRYKVSSDYIGDHIMATPFIPQRKPGDYLVFPAWTEQRPKISLERYQRIAKQEMPKQMLFFVIGIKVLLIANHAHPEHPVAISLQHYAVGQPDLTFEVQQFVVDPDIPYCPTPADISPEVVAWAENYMYETIVETGGIKAAYHVMDLLAENTSTGTVPDGSGSPGCNDNQQQQQADDEQSLREFLEKLQMEMVTLSSMAANASSTANSTVTMEDVFDSSTAPTGSSSQSSELSLQDSTFAQHNNNAEEFAIHSHQKQESLSSNNRRSKARGKSMLNGVFKSLKLSRGSGNIKDKDDSNKDNTTRRQRRKTWAPGINFSSSKN